MKYNYALLSAFASTVSAHTWIEQLMVIAPNGTMVGSPGFARGNVLRSDPGFGDPKMVNLLPPDGRQINQILPTDLMCKDTQTTQTQTDGSPRLQASAGDNIALRYQENGHVTLPQNQPGKPDNRGTIFVYGTTQPQANDAFLSIHRVWNAAGTGGDGRGVLLSTQNFDDSQCYQVNGGQISQTRQKQFAHQANQLMGSDLWCQQDIQIPSTAPSGKPYTLYWVWDWPTLPGTPGFPDGKQEIYTTCMDVDITAGSGQGGNTANSGSQNNVAANNFIIGQDFASAGVRSELAVVANPTAVSGQFIPFSATTGKAGATGALTAPAAASSPINTAAASQPSANAAATTATRHHHHSRPSVSPIGTPNAQPSDNGNPGFGPGDNNNGNNNQPPAANTNSNANNANLNTATAIAAPTPPTGATDAAPSRVTQINTLFNTVTQTKLETVFVTASAGQKRAEVTAVTLLPSSSSKKTCSRTEVAYRLRARKPFYILPGFVESGDEEC